MPDDPIRRTEYENRHKTLEDALRSLAVSMETMRNYVDARMSKLEEDMDRKIEKIEQATSTNNLDVWKLVATDALSFLVGAAGGYLVHFIH